MSELRLGLVGPPKRTSRWRRAAEGLVGAVVAGVHASVDAASADENLQAIVAAVDGDRVAAVARRLVDSGKHFLLHVNSAPTSEAARALETTLEQVGATWMLACDGWFHPSFQTILSRLAGGQLGQAGLLRRHRWRSRQDGGPPAGVGELLPEVLFAEAVFGEPPDMVYARVSGSSWVLHLGFPQGGMALVELAGSEGDSYETLSVIGAKGAAYMDDHHNAQLLLCDGSARAAVTSEHEAGAIAELQEFVGAIGGGRAAGGPRTLTAAAATIAAAARAVVEGSPAAMPSSAGQT